MRTRLHQAQNVQGSVLLIAMGITFVLGLGLASYLTLMRWQHVSVVRSQAWNAALCMAEGGVEEALAQLNPSTFSAKIKLDANDWKLLSDARYHPTPSLRTIDNLYSYDVAITTENPPTIYATGYVRIPALSATLSRAVRVTTATNTLFPGGMAARVNVDLNGYNLETDSFDSQNPLYSTNGLYIKEKRKAGGDIACTEGMINVQVAKVMGTIFTGPAGGYSISTNGNGHGSVGDLAWVVTNNMPGVQPGHYKNDFNMDFPPVSPPYDATASFKPGAGTILGTNYTLLLENSDYMIDGAEDLKNEETIYVAGNARLYVTGDFAMNQGAKIIIAKDASLQLYVGGGKATISTVNNGGNCASFSYFGLPANTIIDLGGNDVFLGSFYAPSATFTLNGGGNNTIDFQGACAVNKIKMNGHFNFHFDENLKRKGPLRGYVVGSWAEI